MRRKPSQLDLFSIPDEPHILQKFRIYRSSAGSGKTFTLARDFLKIVIRDPEDYKHILAITFTNKATTEMKERILENLESIARDEPSDMRTALEEELARDGIVLEERIVMRARRALNNILHDYSRFEVSTIDYFFTRVVRALAKEIDMPMRYDLDVDNEKAMMESIRMLYDDLHDNEDLRSWLEEFSYNRIENNRGWKIDRNIQDLGMELFNETFHTGLEEMKEKRGEDLEDESRHLDFDIAGLREFVGQLHTTIRTIRETLVGLCNRILHIIEQEGMDIGDFKANTARFFLMRSSGEDLEPTATVRSITEDIDTWFAKNSIHRKASLSAKALVDLPACAKEYVEYFDTHQISYQSAVELLKNIYSYGLLGILNEKLKEYKRENNLLLLSDTNLLLRNVIKDRDAPFLYEKIGGRYKFILIDEFQDTSRFQWKNLLPLVINSIANNHQGLIVGDVKQAIYRWRGGDFKLLMEDVNRDLSAYSEHLQEQVLPSNWRSRENVVRFNNAFFDAAQQFLDGNPIFPEGKHYVNDAYKNASQKPEKEAGGYIRIQFFEGGWEWKDESREYTLSLVQELVEQGYSLSDILVLTDTNDLASEISRTLTEGGVRVVTERSLNIASSRLVNLFVSLFYWMVNQQDQNAVATIIYLYSIIQEEEVEYLGISGEESRLSAIMPDGFIERVPYLKAKPVHELTEELILLLNLEDKVDIFLQRFMDLCLEQSVVGNHDLTSFLRWWEDAQRRREKQRELSVVMPANSEAVQIMTIHKAKGLEAPVVIMPFASYRLRSRNNSTFWTTELGRYQEYGILPLNYNKELANSHFLAAYQQESMESTLERLNQTYVAFTRPKERLYVNAQMPKKPSLDKGYDEINDLLWNTLNDPTFALHQHWNSTTMSFEMGEANDVPAKEDGSVPEALERYVAHPFSEKIVLREDSKRFFSLLDVEKSVKIREGIMAHTALESITSPADISPVLQGLVDEGLGDREMAISVEKHLGSLFENPQFSSWFDPGWEVYPERTILNKGKEYRPDRMIIKGQEAIIIDYKREKDESQYHKQIITYADMMEKMGYTVTGRFLVFIQNGQIEEV